MFLFLGNMPTVHGGGGICAILRWGISCKIAEIRPTILGGVPRECRLHEGHIGPGDMEKLAAFIDEGKMKPVVDSVYEMEDVLEVRRFPFIWIKSLATNINRATID